MKSPEEKPVESLYAAVIAVDWALARTYAVLAVCVRNGDADPKTALMALMILRDSFRQVSCCSERLTLPLTEATVMRRSRKRSVTRILMACSVAWGVWAVGVYLAVMVGNTGWVVLTGLMVHLLALAVVVCLRLRNNEEWLSGGDAE